MSLHNDQTNSLTERLQPDDEIGVFLPYGHRRRRCARAGGLQRFTLHFTVSPGVDLCGLNAYMPQQISDVDQVYAGLDTGNEQWRTVETGFKALGSQFNQGNIGHLWPPANGTPSRGNKHNGWVSFRSHQVKPLLMLQKVQATFEATFQLEQGAKASTL